MTVSSFVQEAGEWKGRIWNSVSGACLPGPVWYALCSLSVAPHLIRGCVENSIGFEASAHLVGILALLFASSGTSARQCRCLICEVGQLYI
jgi:hypothetical protein